MDDVTSVKPVEESSDRSHHAGCRSDSGLRVWHVAAAAAGLLICTSGPSQVWTAHVVHGTLSFTYWGFLYPFAAVSLFGVFALSERLRHVRLSEVPWPLFAIGGYAAWALASSIWSVSPTGTPLTMLVNTGITAFGCWIGLTLRFRELLVAIASAMGLAVIASGLAVYHWAEFGITIYGRDQGIFGNPNSLGPVCVLGLLALVGIVVEYRKLSIALACVPLAVLEWILLRGTESDTAFIALMLCLGATALPPIMWWLHRRRFPGVLAAGVGVFICGLAWILLFRSLPSVLRFIHKDITLSQRRYIWDDVRDNISRRPWNGYGLGAFWDSSQLTAYTYHRIGRAYGSAHDSVLEVTLGLGFIGLALYLASAFCAFVGVLRSTWFVRRVSTWWWTMVLVFIVAVNLTESFVLWYSYAWVLFAAAAVAMFGPSLPRTPAGTSSPPESAQTQD